MAQVGKDTDRGPSSQLSTQLEYNKKMVLVRGLFSAVSLCSFCRNLEKTFAVSML